MRYERLLPLGVGGMATVHLALAIGQSGFNRLVVLKSVRDGLPESPEMRQMFVNEARLTARLNHPNIVQAYEIIEDQDTMVLVMEYLDGLSLSEAYRVARHELTLPMRLRIVCEVLTGLHYAHEHTDFQGAPLGIVHRDVTPTNVFVTFDGRIKLVDFGIAKMTAAEDKTRTGMIKGKLAYMPAEQLAGRAIDRRTDIYAVGCILWEAVAGSRIWESRSEGTIARSVLAGKIPALSSRVTVDLAIERIVSKATAADPDARYSTAAEMRDDLEEFMTSQQSATARDVGDVLASISADARSERQKRIARAIRTVEANLALRAQEPSSIQAATPGPQSFTETGSGSALSGPPTRVAPKRRPMRLVVLSSFAVLVSAIAWLQWPREPDSAPTAAPPAPLSVAPTPPSKLTVHATPSAARVFLNGVPVPGTPATIEVPRASTHFLRVELEGHEINERSVRIDADTLVSVNLVRIADAGSSPAAQAEAAPRTTRGRPGIRDTPRPGKLTETPREKPTDKSSCNPPYYFSGGIKTYKPECI